MIKIRNETVQKCYQYGSYVLALQSDKPLYLIDLAKPAKAAGKTLDPKLSDSMWVSISDMKRAIDRVEGGGTHDQNGAVLFWSRDGAVQQEQVQPRTDHRGNAETLIASDEPTFEFDPTIPRDKSGDPAITATYTE
jgi:hypothetical protein